MIREGMKHGFTQDIWNAAKEEARQAIVRCAKVPRTITYSELVQEIRSATLDAFDPRLSHMLGEISSEEDAAGRGMLTVLVVHKYGDRQPGTGFFQLAKSLGRDIRNQEKVWSDEFSKVTVYWSKK